MKRCPVTGEYAECALDCDQQCLAALTDLVTYKGRPPELYRKEYVAAMLPPSPEIDGLQM
ncbi:MAG: hypothetical protein PHU95_03020 [Candidatus Thermoplasmatota archaeon]|nr:hypothetical protein [Candidatus Thermoplasmatota archaeon]